MSLMNTYQSNSCKVCNSKNIKIFIESKDFRLNSSQNIYYLYKCSDCDFIFQKITSPQGYLYDTNFFLNIDFLTKINYFFWKTKIQKIQKKQIKKNKISILDYGCGSGGLVNYLSKEYSIEGYDPYGQFDKNDIKFHNSIDSLGDKKYDLIILSHMLEHVIEINTELKKIYNLLSNNGIIIFEIPNINCFEYFIYKKYFFHLDLPRHVNFFSKTNILIYMDNAKFKKLEINNGITFILAPIGTIRSSIYKIKYENNSFINKLFILLSMPIIFSFSLLFNIIKYRNSYFGGVFKK